MPMDVVVEVTIIVLDQCVCVIYYYIHSHKRIPSIVWIVPFYESSSPYLGRYLVEINSTLSDSNKVVAIVRQCNYIYVVYI